MWKNKVECACVSSIFSGSILPNSRQLPLVEDERRSCQNYRAFRCREGQYRVWWSLIPAVVKRNKSYSSINPTKSHVCLGRASSWQSSTHFLLSSLSNSHILDLSTDTWLIIDSPLFTAQAIKRFYKHQQHALATSRHESQEGLCAQGQTKPGYAHPWRFQLELDIRRISASTIDRGRA